MKKAKSSKSIDFDYQISNMEFQQDEFQNQKKRLLNSLEEFENEMTSSFNRLQEIDEEMVSRGSIQAQWDRQEHQGRQQYIQNFISNQTEEILTSYSKMNQEVETEKEKLRLKKKS